MGLVNVTEALARSLFEEAYLHTNRLKCACEQCQNDILAIALNRLPTRYVSTEQGNAYVKAESFALQSQSDILRELAVAASIVANNPRHAARQPASDAAN